MSADGAAAGPNARERARPGTSGFGIADGCEAPPLLRQQALAVLLVVLLAAAGILWCVVTGLSSSSARPDVFGGSLVVPYGGHDPVVIDLATSRATIRLKNLRSAVTASDVDQVMVVPTDIGTFLVNRQTGTYNLVDRDNVVVLRTGGIDLPPGAAAGATIQAVAAGDGIYLIRQSDRRTEVYLVDRDTVLQGNVETGATKKVAARAAADLRETSSTAPMGVVVAGGALWLVSGGDGANAKLTRFSTDPDPARDNLVVDRVADIPADATLAAGADGTVIAAASGVGRVVLAGAGRGPARELAVTTTKEAKALVGATTDGDGAWLATRADDGGWSVLHIRGDGQVAEPVPVGDSRGINRMRPPLISDGRAWIISGDDGGIRRVDLARGETVRPAGADRYPILEGENPGTDFFAGTTASVRGPRVVINNPKGIQALVVGDGGDQISVVNKAAAIDVDPTASPSPQLKADETPAKPTNAAQSTPTQPVKAKDPITETQACQNLSQTPRKPQIRTLDPTNRSLTVIWLYTKLDPGDCQPSSYLIEAHGADGAEDPVNPVRTHTTAETQFTFTGLRPNRVYEVRVTAVIGANRVASEPMQRKTDDAGPDAAKSVSTTADQPGGWNISWISCKGNECDVAPATWEVSWALCGNGSFIGEQAPLSGLPAGQRQATLSLSQHPDLVGKFLTFTVTSISAQGQRASMSDGACNEGWNPPNGARVVLLATGASAPNGSVTIRASVEATPEKLAVFGASAPQFTYASDGVVVGPTSALSVDLIGLAPGVPHEVSVTVSVHGSSAKAPPKTVDAIFRDWPAMHAELTIAPTGNNRATVTITVVGAPTAPVLAQAQLNCGGSFVPSPFGSTLQNGQLVWSASLVDDLAPQCVGDVQLGQVDHPTYSGQVSLHTNVYDIPVLNPPPLSFAWADDGRFGIVHAVARVTGTIPAEGADWRLVPAEGTSSCDVSQPLDPGPVPPDTFWEGNCVNDQNQVTVQVRYLRGAHPFTYTVAGTRPTQPAPTTTTTIKPTTTTKPVTTTTAATTTTAGFIGETSTPLGLLVAAAGVVLTIRGVRRVRVDRVDHAVRPPALAPPRSARSHRRGR